MQSAEIDDGTVAEVDLNVTNAPTDNYFLTYNSAGGNFTWVSGSGDNLGNHTVTQDLLPQTTGLYDLGSPTFEFGNIYTTEIDIVSGSIGFNNTNSNLNAQGSISMYLDTDNNQSFNSFSISNNTGQVFEVGDTPDYGIWLHNSQKIVFSSQTSNPPDATEGSLYYNSTANEFRYSDGSSWITIASGSGVGDITAVNAGTALTGGGTSGSVTLNVEAEQVPTNATDLGPSKDLNTYEASSEVGFYFQDANVDASSGTNYPENKAGTLLVTKNAGVNQQYWTYNDGSPEMWFRGYYSAAWSPWRKVYHTGNDGSGSGLDADLLDGQTGGNYLRSNASDSASGIMSFTNATNSTSKDNGAVVITAGGLGVEGEIHAGGDIEAFNTSDKRLKQNIKPIKNPIEKIQALSGNSYEWKGFVKMLNGKEGKDVGVIAQEVEKVVPEAVRESTSGYLQVNYDKLVPLLIEAVKDQQKQIDELRAEIKRLKK